jgi:hypothetical protein
MRAPAELTALSGLAVAAIATAAAVILLRSRKNPRERERLRRLSIYRAGRMGDGTITGASDEILYYSYSVRGVEYAASQDISGIRDRVPDDPESLIGPATVKFAPGNPFNSIVLCEEWSGFRKQSTLFQKGA